MYQVWTKEEFEGWKRQDCADLETALAAVLTVTKQGKEPLLTVEVPFEVGIKITEGKQHEVTQGKTIKHKGPEGKSHGQVRRGDETTPPGLDSGSGDNRPDPVPGN